MWTYIKQVYHTAVEEQAGAMLILSGLVISVVIVECSHTIQYSYCKKMTKRNMQSCIAFWPTFLMFQTKKHELTFWCFCSCYKVCLL